MSFDPTLATDRDFARHVLGDTGTNAFLPDETYDALLARFDLKGAIQSAAGALVAKYQNAPDHISESGGVTLTWKQRLEAWKKLAEGGAIPGLSTSGAPRSGQIPSENRGKFR